MTTHEEIRDCLIKDLSGSGTAQEIAQELSLSVSTVRRYLAEMVQRGWVVRNRTWGTSGYLNAIAFDIVAGHGLAFDNSPQRA